MERCWHGTGTEISDGRKTAVGVSLCNLGWSWSSSPGCGPRYPSSPLAPPLRCSQSEGGPSAQAGGHLLRAAAFRVGSAPQKSPGALTGTSPRRGNFAGQEGFRDCVPSGALPRPRCARHPCAEVAQVSSRSRSWVSRRSPLAVRPGRRDNCARASLRRQRSLAPEAVQKSGAGARPEGSHIVPRARRTDFGYLPRPPGCPQPMTEGGLSGQQNKAGQRRTGY
jgi:hypothetical protein